MKFYEVLAANKYVVERYSTVARGYSSTTIYKGDDESAALAKFNGVKPEKMIDVTLYTEGKKSDQRKGAQQ
jgi:hypothetical protein